MIVDEDTKGNITPDKARRMVRKIIKAQAKKSAVSKNNGEMKNE